MTVEWMEVALDQSADLYACRPLFEQRALAATVERMNAELAADTWHLGESRGDLGRRVWFAGPLVVAFRIDPAGVVVTPAHPAGPGGRG